MKSAATLILVLAAALSLTACASDGDMWGRRHGDGDRHGRDRDHDGDRHGAAGVMVSPSGLPAPVVAQG